MRNGLLLPLLAAALCAPAWAVNKCTGADGKIEYQDAPCSSASKSSARVKTWETQGYEGTSSSAPDKGTPNPKLVGPPAAEPLLKLYRRWADAERLAMSTSRIALSGPAATLQALHREVESLQTQPCLDEAKATLTTLIAKSTESILKFMSHEEAAGMLYQFLEKRKLVPEFERLVSSAKCSP